MASTDFNIKQDTGWITLNSTYPTYYRAKDGFTTVVMRLGGGSIPTSGKVLGTIPQAYRPKYQMVVTTHNLKGNVMVDVNGEVIITENSGQTLNAYMGAVLTYPY